MTKTINCVETQCNKYYAKPKKSNAGRCVATGLGLGTTALAIGSLINESASGPSQGFFNPTEIIKNAGKTGAKTALLQRLLPLGLAALALTLGTYGIGSAIDNINYKRNIKNAQKRALKLEQEEKDMDKETLDVKA